MGWGGFGGPWGCGFRGWGGGFGGGFNGIVVLFVLLSITRGGFFW